MNTWVTRDLASYACLTSLEHYPQQVVEQCKLFVLDTIGCMVGGMQTALGQSMARSLKKAGGTGRSTIVGAELALSVTDAALLNGTTANALDFEETLAGIGHPSGTVIGAALAAGEDRRISGAQFLDAVLVGYDVGNRIGRAIQPSYERLKQVWFVGTWQTFGAVAAAAKCLDLDLDQTLNAYGTAGATAPLPNTQKWGWEAEERPIHWVKEPTGWPGWAGTLAALLAEEGFVGNRHILDGEKGFWAMAGSDRCDFDAMTHGLGSRYEVMELSFKPYSCCRWQHPALDCVVELMHRHELTAADVERVDVHSFDWLQDFEVYGPVDLVDAGFSMPHCITMLLHAVPPGPEWFVAERLHDAKVIDYSRRVHVHFDEGFNRAFHQDGKLGARVHMALRGGGRVSAEVDTALGCPDKPWNHAAIEAKFRSLVAPVLGENAATKIIHDVARLETLTDIAPFVRGLRRARSSQPVDRAAPTSEP